MGTTAEYPGALWVPADPSNYHTAMRLGGAITNIVTHCTDGHARAMPVAQMWQEQAHGSSAHFVIDQDGTVIQCVLLKDIAYHAHRVNRYSVGIEHCCRSPGELGKDDPGLPASEAQLQASAKLVAWLCSRLGLAADRQVIRGHAEIDPVTTHKDCPTSVIDLDAYVRRVQPEYAALQLPAPPPASTV